jgi:hypothetical protein
MQKIQLQELPPLWNHDDIGSRLLRALIVLNGSTQTELAEKYGIHIVAFNEMLNGKRRFKKGLLPMLLHDLGAFDLFRNIGLI